VRISVYFTPFSFKSLPPTSFLAVTSLPFLSKNRHRGDGFHSASPLLLAPEEDLGPPLRRPFLSLTLPLVMKTPVTLFSFSPRTFVKVPNQKQGTVLVQQIVRRLFFRWIWTWGIVLASLLSSSFFPRLPFPKREYPHIVSFYPSKCRT